MLKQLLSLSALVTLSTAAFGAELQTDLIGGKVVDPAIVNNSVVMLDLGNGSCTATIVGPKVILTAGHCAADSSQGSIDNGSNVARLTANPNFDPSKGLSEVSPVNFDIGLGILAGAVDSSRIMKIGGSPVQGQTATLFGYGCTNSNISGGNNGELKAGDNLIDAIYGIGFALRNLPNGASGCPGDSGGPTLTKDDSGAYELIGVNVTVKAHQGLTGPIMEPETNAINVSEPRVQKYLADFAAKNKVEICGINADCVPIK